MNNIPRVLAWPTESIIYCKNLNWDSHNAFYNDTYTFVVSGKWRIADKYGYREIQVHAGDTIRDITEALWIKPN